MVLYFAPRIPEHHDWVLAYLLEMGPGTGGAAGGGSKSADVRMELTPMPPAATRDSDFSDAPAFAAKPAVSEATNDLAPRSTAMESLTTAGIRDGRAGGRGGHGGLSSGGGGGAGAGIGSGTGDGSGGGGLQVAHADYGASPTPAYPSRSRQRAEEGTVTLHILIAADGSVARIEIAQSSGFDDLDRSALETVRQRWRFVPARRSDGHPVESWVLVPIRFALR
jgi:TonB family protein